MARKSNITFIRKVRERKPKKVKQRANTNRQTGIETKTKEETKYVPYKDDIIFTNKGYFILDTPPNSSHVKQEKLRQSRNKKYSDAIERYNNGEISSNKKNELCRRYSRDYKLGIAKLEDKEAKKNRKAFGTKRPLNFTYAKNQQNGINMNNSLNINKK